MPFICALASPRPPLFSVAVAVMLAWPFAVELAIADTSSDRRVGPAGSWATAAIMALKAVSSCLRATCHTSCIRPSSVVPSHSPNPPETGRMCGFWELEARQAHERRQQLHIAEPLPTAELLVHVRARVCVCALQGGGVGRT